MTDPHDWIKNLANDTLGKILIVVEGEDDKAMLEALFGIVKPGWRFKFALAPVGGKKRVYQACKDALGSNWRGLVDCDEWGEDRVHRESATTPNVKILPRFTAENFWINPDELFELIPAHYWKNFPDARVKIKTDIESALPDWVAHGVMWKIMLKRQSGFGDLKFPNELMERPVTDETQIRDILTRWHNYLDPNAILDEYRRELEAAQRLTQNEQYSQVVHGKRFFHQVITLTLNRAFHTLNRTHEDWTKDLTATTKRLDVTQIPPDLLSTLNALLA